MTLSLHRCKVCGTRWLLWPDAIHGGGWNLLDEHQRPGACCDNAAMGDQIEHLRDFDLGAAQGSAPRSSDVAIENDVATGEWLRRAIRSARSKLTTAEIQTLADELDREGSAPRETAPIEDGDILRECGMDGQKWAAAFMRLYETDRLVFDEGTMIAWFCNAIMAGFDEANRRHEREAASGGIAPIPAAGEDLSVLPGETRAEVIGRSHIRRLEAEVDQLHAALTTTEREIETLQRHARVDDVAFSSANSALVAAETRLASLLQGIKDLRDQWIAKGDDLETMHLTPQAHICHMHAADLDRLLVEEPGR